jgi:FkbM family methyltransferase
MIPCGWPGGSAAPPSWMRFIKFFKTLFRSRSLDFALHSNRSGVPHEVRTLRRKGVLIHYRPGGSDVENIVKKLLKRDSEYWLPPRFEPRSILDLGANIGIASIDFALRYPQASIIAIEPVAANFQLLQKNISGFPNIRALNVAVGKHDERAALRGAGQSFRTQPVSASSKAKRREETTVRDLNALLKENEITQVDLIKIDVEGSEYDVLTSLDPSLLQRVQWIVGELHSVQDFALLDYLSAWFEIDGRKTITKECWKFHAVNRDHAARFLTGFDLKKLQC